MLEAASGVAHRAAASVVTARTPQDPPFLDARLVARTKDACDRVVARRWISAGGRAHKRFRCYGVSQRGNGEGSKAVDRASCAVISAAELGSDRFCMMVCYRKEEWGKYS